MEDTQESTAPDTSTAAEATTVTESQEQTTPQAGTGQEQDGKTPEQSVEAFTIPDGFEMDANGREETSQFFVELSKIEDPKVREQMMIDKHFESIGNQADRADAAQHAQNQEWAAAVRSDKEFGGANLAENLAGARKAMNMFSDPAVDTDGKAMLHAEGQNKGQQMTEIEVWMNNSGRGNDPTFIRMFHRINQAISEDRFVAGSMKPHESTKTPAQTMYPDMK